MMNNLNVNKKQISVNGIVINYTILDPSGNITALVSNNNIDVSDVNLRKKINDAILDKNPEVEQVGFLTKINDNANSKNGIWKIQMAGNEFCGNASRAFACYLFDNKLVYGDKFSMMCSGNDNVLNAEIDLDKSKNKTYYSNVKIPIKKKVKDFIKNRSINKSILQDFDIFPETSIGIINKKVNEKINVDVVKLDGITHILIDDVKFPREDESICKRKAKEIIDALNLQNEPAVGVIWCNFNTNTINPFVWVKDVNTIYYENACGSGSLAYGIRKSTMQDNNNISVRQKNGEIIDVNVDCDGDFINSSSIGGKTIIKENKSFDIVDNNIIELSNKTSIRKDTFTKNAIKEKENISLDDISQGNSIKYNS